MFVRLHFSESDCLDIPYVGAAAAIDQWANRPIGGYVLRQAGESRRRGKGGRSYVAALKSSPAHDRNGRQGFIISIEN